MDISPTPCWPDVIFDPWHPGICRIQPQRTSHGHSSLHGAQALSGYWSVTQQWSACVCAHGVPIQCPCCAETLTPPSLHDSIPKCCEASPAVPFFHRYWSPYRTHDRAWLHLQQRLSRQLAGNKASFQAILAAKCDSLVCELH